MSKEKKVLYQKVFINDWLDDSLFKDWLRKHEENTKETFIFCPKTIMLSSAKVRQSKCKIKQR